VFADGTVFSAKPDTSTPPLLTISVPFGLQFGGNPGRILVQGDGQGGRTTSVLIDTNNALRVPTNQTLALVGGELSLEGATLKTAGGRIELGSVAQNSLVTLTPTQNGFELGYGGAQNFGDIQLSQQATVDASGAGGGVVRVTGRRITLTDGSNIEASTLGSQLGGSLVVNASESVELRGISTNGQIPSGLYAFVYSGATGSGGELRINTGTLLVRDGAVVDASTYGQGNGGKLTVNASNNVQLGSSVDGQLPSLLDASAQPSSKGNGGDLTINTPTLLVRDGSQVVVGTFGQGNAGNLTVNASSGVQLIGTSADGHYPSGLLASAQPGASGKAGDLTINTDTLQVRDGAQVQTATFGQGNGGKLTVNAFNAVQLIGTSTDGHAASGLFASAQPGASGKAGDLKINTDTLLVRDGARVSVRSGQGQAGNMTIIANSLFLNRGTLIAETAKSDALGGANITLSDLDLLRMDNESLISANAGNQATGGNISVDSTFIVATSPTGPKGSDITANATKGKGGAVNIATQGLYGIEFRPKLTPKNDITVSSDSGVNGTFQLSKPFVEPTQSLTTLPTEIVDDSRQIVQNCRAVRGQGQEENKFIITGRGGIPASPDQPLLNQEAIAPNWVTLDSEAENNTPPTSTTLNSSIPEPLREANGWIINDLGQVELMATAPTITPHSPWQPPVNCRQVSQTEPL
jgi:large exoprotein involved in heme utilization and adhesion